MANRFNAPCGCCKCPASENTWTDVIAIPYKQAICFTHDTSTVVTTVTSWVETRTYAGGSVVSETRTTTTTTDTQTSDIHTVTDELAWGNFVGPTLSSLPVTSASTFEFTPPEAVDGSVEDYVRVRRYTVTRVFRTMRWRKRLAIEFDASPVRSFGVMQQSNPALTVIRNGGFFWEAGRTVDAGTGSSYLGIAKGVAINTPLPLSVAEFDAAFAAQPRTQPLGPSFTVSGSAGGVSWLPTEEAETLTLYFDQGASPGSGNVGNPRLMIQEFNTRVVDWRISPSNWVSDEVQTEPTFMRTWTMLRALPSNDIQFAHSLRIDALEAPGTFTASYSYTFRLVDANSDDDVLFIAFNFDDYFTVPDWANVNDRTWGRTGTLRIIGLGIDLDAKVAFGRFRPASDLMICLYDDTLQIVPIVDGGAINSDTDTFTDIITWRDDREWLTSGQRLVLQRDPLIAPAVIASISTPNDNVYLRAFHWKQTESLQAIGQDRIPYDPELDETKDPRGCPEAEEFCLLVGTEENLRVAADIVWGSLIESVPLAAGKCVANTTLLQGNLTVASNPLSNNVFFAPFAFYQFDSTINFIPGSPPTSVATATVIQDHASEDRFPLRIDYKCEIKRNELGLLDLEITLNLGYWGHGISVEVWIGGPSIAGRPDFVRLPADSSPVTFTRYTIAVHESYSLKWIVPIGESLDSIADLPAEIILSGADAELTLLPTVNDGISQSRTQPRAYTIYEDLSFYYEPWEWIPDSSLYRGRLSMSPPTEVRMYQDIQLTIRPQSYLPFAANGP